MKHRLAFVLLLVAVALSLAACRKPQPETARVLVFTKTAGFRHDSIPAGIEAIRRLGQEHGFEVDATEDASRFTEETLRQYAAVVFLNTTGDVLDHRQEADFERYLQAGGGFVGVHAAADTEYHWPWYGKLVGAYFDSHPPGTAAAKLVVTDTRHPATRDLPDAWRHTDEWYNFKQVNAQTQVLVTVDERSYRGGTMGASHPISWYHDYDGGRAFYTALGHTDAAYADPAFLQYLWGGLRYAIGEQRPLDYARATRQRAPAHERFSKQVLSAGGFYEPTEMAILPNLDVVVAQRRGELLLYRRADATLTRAGFLKVYFQADSPEVNAEEGLLGLAADPDFAKNHYLYVFYSPAQVSVNRLSRFVFEHGKLVPESEKVILQFPAQRQICCHTGGSIAFGPDGLLYLSTGDNTDPYDAPGQPYVTDGFAPADDRPGFQQYDGRRTASNTDDLRGKILRIRVNADGSYDVPDGNLFQASDKTRPEIYVMGTRNPYRISVDRKRNILYWGEVGPDATKDDPLRGPRGYDEINQAKAAGYYGYPLFIADNQAYRVYDYATGQSGAAHDPARPINDSRNNSGLRELPPAQSALIWYSSGKSEQFPLVGAGSRCAAAGPVYYSEFYPSATRLPSYYDGKLFVYDWMRGWIMAVTLDEHARYSKMERFLPGVKFNAPIDMELGPDGRLYVLEYGKGWYSKNPDAALSRIDYHGDAQVPVTETAVAQKTGALPVKKSAAKVMPGHGESVSPQSAPVAPGVMAGQRLLEASDCQVCHKANDRLIGPSFAQVSAKYRHDPKSPQYLADKITQGGSGVWGQVAMPAHPTISRDDALQIVDYIYSHSQGHSDKVH